MKAFIEISKFWRSKYQKELPFIYVMAKKPMRDDIKLTLVNYAVYKAINL